MGGPKKAPILVVWFLFRNFTCTPKYRALSKHINNWCSPYTIETWLRSHPTYNVYAKNIKPGLTVQNREKQVFFSKHVRNLWGLPPGKFLWIHGDKNSFMHLYRAVTQRHAKSWGYYESRTRPIISSTLGR